ncbi:MAG: DUF2970 domain-containing protein [Pseudomonadota bacterium]|nr:DUF2970 domain-containing protein [Pseudomonadota bacterium]
MTDQQESLEKKEGKKKGRGMLGLLQSTVAAIFGIQSDKNREQDFKQGDASQFVAMGIIAVIALVITMIVVVNNVLDAAAK